MCLASGAIIQADRVVGQNLQDQQSVDDEVGKPFHFISGPIPILPVACRLNRPSAGSPLVWLWQLGGFIFLIGHGAPSGCTSQHINALLPEHPDYHHHVSAMSHVATMTFMDELLPDY